MRLVAYSLTGESQVRRGIVVQEGGIVEVPGDFRALGPGGVSNYAAWRKPPEGLPGQAAFSQAFFKKEGFVWSI